MEAQASARALGSTSIGEARAAGFVRRAGRSRLAPWLLPLGLVVMVATIHVSVPLSFAGSLLAAAGLAATFDWLDRRFRRRG